MHKLTIKLAVRTSTGRLKRVEIDAVSKDLKLSDMKRLWEAETAVNELTPIRMHLELIEVPEDTTPTEPIGQ